MRKALLILILITGMLVSATQFRGVTVDGLVEAATFAIGASANARVNENLAHTDVTPGSGNETPTGAVIDIFSPLELFSSSAITGAVMAISAAASLSPEI